MNSFGRTSACSKVSRKLNVVYPNANFRCQSIRAFIHIQVPPKERNEGCDIFESVQSRPSKTLLPTQGRPIRTIPRRDKVIGVPEWQHDYPHGFSIQLLPISIWNIVMSWDHHLIFEYFLYSNCDAKVCGENHYQLKQTAQKKVTLNIQALSLNTNNREVRSIEDGCCPAGQVLVCRVDWLLPCELRLPWIYCYWMPCYPSQHMVWEMVRMIAAQVMVNSHELKGVSIPLLSFRSCPSGRDLTISLRPTFFALRMYPTVMRSCCLWRLYYALSRKRV